MIVIDTHVFIWWTNSPEKLSSKARQRIQKEKDEGTIFISSMSVWELYLLIKKNRLRLQIEIETLIEKIEGLPYIQFVPIDNKVAARSVTLPGEFHNDPADRMIVATARGKGIPLITADEKIQNYQHVQTIW